ncbi:MAG: trimethylamine methyltransferase family protein [Deltaproteobacteria bacterium]|nr:trimethylamine methyltransferase family protein [Deltaproteobacteria bacterium]MBW2490063.1 trimethylamine methyltransferase family protein [Deltaproteobacteria bacterium]
MGIFKQNGVKTDGNIVYFQERDVRQALYSAPSQFQIKARNPEKGVTIGGDHLVNAFGFGTACMVDSSGNRRDAVMEDYDNFCKLVYTSKYIDMNGCMMVEPSDIPPDIVPFILHTCGILSSYLSMS